MNEKKFFEKTSFETNPVENFADALRAFVDAYDILQAVLAEFADDAVFSEELRAELYRPVFPHEDAAPISLYEVGVVFTPEAAKYTIIPAKLAAALKKRDSDVRALFTRDDGILNGLSVMLAEFLTDETHEFICAAALRFLNECRRLSAMLT